MPEARLQLTRRAVAEHAMLVAGVTGALLVRGAGSRAMLGGVAALAAVLTSTAVHEGAHALAARLHGIRVHGLVVRGLVSAAVRRSPAHDARGHALTCLAGPAASGALLAVAVPLALTARGAVWGTYGQVLALADAVAVLGSVLPLPGTDAARALAGPVRA
ncbi:hypothetical protein EV189_0612 [Motilibacter rhizosphaerae]|uniref:Peptidase M50B-like protein n=1 Tax=Motilibacter rhizosphaerae TaxID=598652 RepID=A0A4Q7NVT5_9ACTN|nr:hypothetical protein [Motilibacter rhizosphaerae]RZS91371.1 hypothetical protein EV189_0612 [Motilibacter rhizosphaerae]